MKRSFKIKEVIKNSPAHAADLLKEDVILRIKGKPATILQLQRTFRNPKKRYK